MPEKCLLVDRICYGNCEHCGWNADEAKRRQEMVAANKLTTGKGGIKKLIIKRKASEK